MFEIPVKYQISLEGSEIRDVIGYSVDDSPCTDPVANMRPIRFVEPEVPFSDRPDDGADND